MSGLLFCLNVLSVLSAGEYGGIFGLMTGGVRVRYRQSYITLLYHVDLTVCMGLIRAPVASQILMGVPKTKRNNTQLHPGQRDSRLSRLVASPHMHPNSKLSLTQSLSI